MMPVAADTSGNPGGHFMKRAVDPLLPVTAVAALVVFALHGFEGKLTRDLGIYGYGGMTVADGMLPYEGIVNRAGPLAHAVPGLAAAIADLVGADPLFSMRVLFLALSVVAVAVLYVVARDLFESRSAGLVAAASMTCFHGFIGLATNGPREKTLMVALVALAMLAVLRGNWATAGLWTALATLTWQPAFFSLIVLATVAALVGAPGHRVAALVRVAVGGAVPTAIVLAVYALAGHLRMFLDCFLLINARYTRQGSPLLDDPSQAWQFLVSGYGPTIWVLLAGFIGLLGCAVAAIVRRGTWPAQLTVGLWAYAGGLLAGTAWTLRALDNWPDTLVLLPYCAVGLAGAASVLIRRVPSPAAIATTSALLVALVSIALTYSIGARDHQLRDQRASVETVKSILGEDVDITSFSAPEVMVLADRRNYARIQTFGNGLDDYVADTRPLGLEGYAAWFLRERPTVIATNRRRVPDWMMPRLVRSYAYVGRSPSWSWYVRRDVGPDTLDRLEDALRDST